MRRASDHAVHAGDLCLTPPAPISPVPLPPCSVSAQAGVEEVCGKIRVKVHWESETFAANPEDCPRLFLRDVFAPQQKVTAERSVYGWCKSCGETFAQGEEKRIRTGMKQ